jgi:hypothetical protein
VPGAEYKPHYDYFDPGEPGTPTILKRGGQRVGTLVMYLNEPERAAAPPSRCVPGSGAQARQRGVLQLRAPAPFHPHAARRRAGDGGARKWIATKWLREAPAMKVKANGIDIEVVLLIMGLGMQLVAWPPAMVQALVDAGYRVIRHDNRDIGLSQHFDHLGAPNLLWTMVKPPAGHASAAPYTLADMALPTRWACWTRWAWSGPMWWA